MIIILYLNKLNYTNNTYCYDIFKCIIILSLIEHKYNNKLNLYSFSYLLRDFSETSKAICNIISDVSCNFKCVNKTVFFVFTFDFSLQLIKYIVQKLSESLAHVLDHFSNDLEHSKA